MESIVLRTPDNFRDRGVDSGAHSLTRTQIWFSMACQCPFLQFYDRTVILKTTLSELYYWPGHKTRSFRPVPKMSRMLWLLTRHRWFYIPVVYFETEPETYSTPLLSWGLQSQSRKETNCDSYSSKFVNFFRQVLFSKPPSGSSVNTLKLKFKKNIFFLRF